jgi:flagellar biosynthesis anti-sigma factor FlgM
MKISGRAPEKIGSPGLAGIAPRQSDVVSVTSTPRGRGSQDRVEISSDASDFLLIKAAVALVPDVREDLVSALKTAIENGTYHVPAAVVAEKILRESLLNASIGN